MYINDSIGTDTKVLKSDKDFKAAIIKMFQWAILSTLEITERSKMSQQINWRYKEKSNRNCRTKKYKTEIKTHNELNSRMKKIKGRINKLEDGTM